MSNLQIKNFISKKDNSKLHIITDKRFILKSKIAAFDLDHTLIRPKGNNKKRFYKNKDDWIWTDNKWPNIIKELNNNDYSIIIFTNQAGINRNIIKLPDLFYKINNVHKDIIDIPIEIYISPAKDKFRKPNNNMWKFMLHLHKKNMPKIDIDNSFYIGDAAGRSSDFSNSDEKFAQNIGIQFYTPENFIRHYYLNKHLSINPELIILSNNDIDICNYFYTSELERSGYKLKKTNEELEEGLRNAESIVYICNNDNYDNIIDLAKRYGIKIKILTNIKSYIDPTLPSQFDCKIIIP